VKITTPGPRPIDSPPNVPAKISSNSICKLGLGSLSVGKICALAAVILLITIGTGGAAGLAILGLGIGVFALDAIGVGSFLIAYSQTNGKPRKIKQILPGAPTTIPSNISVASEQKVIDTLQDSNNQKTFITQTMDIMGKDSSWTVERVRQKWEKDISRRDIFQLKDSITPLQKDPEHGFDPAFSELTAAFEKQNWTTEESLTPLSFFNQDLRSVLVNSLAIHGYTLSNIDNNSPSNYVLSVDDSSATIECVIPAILRNVMDIEAPTNTYNIQIEAKFSKTAELIGLQFCFGDPLTNSELNSGRKTPESPASSTESESSVSP